ncbi:uncharacterized protein LOC103186108 isoform X3 [Callorhinchus milii]|uniref:uncharacterized protein LOC103186108 isoform X3 n=1 Tax=Callorhinchus milii TaxID=7868 RepID=UPI00045725AB|nr:uncharacterized protein LOC103186108 isoform X3 [Callorhinchus milii]|eukprot:gi/632973416/ref/XP_007903144.1/ PREDICTED: uncharacterized protein LOC103186108 isoform X3 [Callorhinchus milii]
MPNQTATTPPDGTRRGSIIGFMLIPVTIIVGIAIAVFVIIYIRKRRRIAMILQKRKKANKMIIVSTVQTPAVFFDPINNDTELGSPTQQIRQS